jgi:hypothetical protein
LIFVRRKKWKKRNERKGREEDRWEDMTTEYSSITTLNKIKRISNLGNPLLWLFVRTVTTYFKPISTYFKPISTYLKPTLSLV